MIIEDMVEMMASYRSESRSDTELLQEVMKIVDEREDSESVISDDEHRVALASVLEVLESRAYERELEE